MRRAVFVAVLALSLLTSRLGIGCEVLVLSGSSGSTLPTETVNALAASGYQVDFSHSGPLRDSTHRVILVWGDPSAAQRLELSDFIARGRASGVIFAGDDRTSFNPPPDWAAHSGATEVSFLDGCAAAGESAILRSTPGNVAGHPGGTLLAGCDELTCGALARITALMQRGGATIDATYGGVWPGILRRQISSLVRTATMSTTPHSYYDHCISGSQSTPAALSTTLVEMIEWCAFGPPAPCPGGGPGGSGGCDLTGVTDALHVLADAIDDIPPPVPCNLAPVLTRLDDVLAEIAALSVAACDLSPVLTALATLDTRLSALETRIDGVDTTLALVRTDVADARTAIASTQASLDAVAADVAANTAALATIEATVGTLAASVDAVAAEIVNLAAEVTALEASVDANTAGLASLETAVNTNSSRLAGVETAVAANTARLAAVEAGVADNGVRLGLVEGRLSSIEDLLRSLAATHCELIRLATTPEGQRSSELCGGHDHRGSGR